MSVPAPFGAVPSARAESQRAQAVLEADPRAARRHLLEARHLDPGDAGIARDLGLLELRLGLHAEALENLGRARSLAGDSAELLALSGLCRLRLRGVEEAEALAERALALEPGNRAALEVRADCLRARGDWPRAAEDCRVLLRAAALGEAARARVELKLARCLLGQGAHAAAWELVEGLEKRGYDGAPVRDLRRDCERGQRGELDRAFGGSGWWGRAQWWLARRSIAQALSLGSRRGREAAAGAAEAEP